ncbi:MAG TPA: biopolymer transporter ExbD [Chthoniobacterales bacterium]|jgi:biopolymer transport protein ExbD|nr:biopolymer transporter ExbD [Chthoniobacterales bacterium]
MRRFSDRQTLHTLTEINITPLLDLAFVLLIIFIITTPLMEKSVNLEVPTSGEANQSVDSSTVQTIGIDRDNVITFNDETVDLSTLESRLIALRTEKPEAPVIVRPDKSLTVQQLVSVMDVLQRAKISKVGVATRSEQSE